MNDWKKYTSSSEALGGKRFGHVSAAVPAHLLRLAEQMQIARAMRPGHFNPAIVGEAGWDMLLAAYVAEGRGYRLTVSDICNESGVPPTTALRWLTYIEQQGLIDRQPHPSDRRRVFVTLSRQGLERMTLYLAKVHAMLSHDQS